MTIDKKKKIIIDADIIIHFIKGDQLGLLCSVLENKLYIFKEVFDEVFKGRTRTQIENMITFNQLEELSIKADMNVFREFARLKKTYGPGESACMAYCRFNNDVLASSNLKDIKSYCAEHKIQYLTTMDFIYIAFLNGKMNTVECDDFILKVLKKGSKLPCKSMQEYLTKFKS
ncbi:hypothetical protein [Olleya sp. Bg11-27]|uniref:hypothetical protein n=1 Tax=Olleya sp. Bg11-27 TaxID=2058135 RepID=UPI000C302D37|nr:hypothetical protein [Olleya sp. Bg11-27]AUC75663.1 hypothetical protein CW732_08250 [Olleya sp. Bg11-27]